ncbi:MAG: hypothetical protein WC058_12730 [Phycisphaeraceae bacterium]
MKPCDAIVRETMEWANLWWSHADDPARRCVLLVGDSIAVGYSTTVMSELDDLAYVDRLGGSRAVNDPCWAKELAYMLGEYDIPGNDLYQLASGNAAWRSPDGYHYTPEAQAPLGRAVASAIRSILHGQ